MDTLLAFWLNLFLLLGVPVFVLAAVAAVSVRLVRRGRRSTPTPPNDPQGGPRA